MDGFNKRGSFRSYFSTTVQINSSFGNGSSLHSALQEHIIGIVDSSHAQRTSNDNDDKKKIFRRLNSLQCLLGDVNGPLNWIRRNILGNENTAGTQCVRIQENWT